MVIESDTEPYYYLVEQYAIKVFNYEPDREDEYLEIEATEVIPMNDIIEELLNEN